MLVLFRIIIFKGSVFGISVSGGVVEGINSSGLSYNLPYCVFIGGIYG